jgi:serine/threonine-protein kinase
VDHRADLYALGIILYEMLAGRPPFQDDDVTAVLESQLKHAPRELPSRVPPTVRAIVSALLVKAPAKRLGSAAELVARIDEALATDPALAEQSPALPAARASAAPGRAPTGAGPDAEARLAPTRLAMPRAAANGPVRAAAGADLRWQPGPLRYVLGVGPVRMPGWLVGALVAAGALSIAAALGLLAGLLG